jgi:hypothetical protein
VHYLASKAFPVREFRNIRHIGVKANTDNYQVKDFFLLPVIIAGRYYPSGACIIGITLGYIGYDGVESNVRGDFEMV